MTNHQETYREIPFSPPDLTEMEMEEVVSAMRSGWITTGPRVKRLEKALAFWIGVPDGTPDGPDSRTGGGILKGPDNRTDTGTPKGPESKTDGGGTPNCVCLNSQTACAELCLRLLGIGPQEGGRAEDEVIVPAYTYTASASVVAHVGAKLVLIDCRPDGETPEMDPAQLEAAINSHTKAVIPVDVGGIPCDYQSIFDILEEKASLFRPSNPLQEAIGRVAVVEDASHALGALWHGRRVGTIGDFTNFSFHAVKNLTTAEGGALVWTRKAGVDDGELYRRIQLYSLHGQSKDALAKSQTGAWEYDILGPWYKCNMTDIAAAMGLGQLERYPGLLNRRREIVQQYDAALEPLGLARLPHYTTEHTSSGHLYMTRVPGADRRRANAIMARMAQRGVSCNVHYKPLPMMTAYRNLGFRIEDYPNAYRWFENEITLPLHTRLCDEDVAYVAEAYREAVRECP